MRTKKHLSKFELLIQTTREAAESIEALRKCIFRMNMQSSKITIMETHRDRLFNWFDMNYSEDRQTIIKILRQAEIASCYNLQRFYEACSEILEGKDRIDPVLKDQIKNLSIMGNRGIVASKAGKILKGIIQELSKDYSNWKNGTFSLKLALDNLQKNSKMNIIRRFGARRGVIIYMLIENKEI